jgi:hypothetical protein
VKGVISVKNRKLFRTKYSLLRSFFSVLDLNLIAKTLKVITFGEVLQ